jgi:hypothetical protein
MEKGMIKEAIKNDDYELFFQLVNFDFPPKAKYFIDMGKGWHIFTALHDTQTLNFLFLLILLEEGSQECIQEFLDAFQQKWNQNKHEFLEQPAWINRYSVNLVWLLSQKVQSLVAEDFISGIIDKFLDYFSTRKEFFFKTVLGYDLCAMLLPVHGCQVPESSSYRFHNEDVEMDHPLFFASQVPRKWRPFGGPCWSSCDDDLLKNVEDINKIHPKIEKTPLGFALENGNLYTSSKLLEMGADMKFALEHETKCFTLDESMCYFLAKRGWANTSNEENKPKIKKCFQVIQKIAISKIRFLPLGKSKRLQGSLLRILIFKENKLIWS